MLVIAAPGQGAQIPGFLAPWLDLPGVADRLTAWSDLAGCDLIACGTTAGAEEITDTAIAQPLLVAAALAAADALSDGLRHLRRQAGIAAGHSVGELAAGAIAGAITPEDAMRLVSVRGRAMAKAAAAEATGMTAVLGGDQDEVLAALGAHGLTPANVNGAGQIVAAGTMTQLAALEADPPAGARLRPLTVAGAFHTAHMAPAVAALREAAAGVTVSDPAMVLLSNADGAPVKSGRDWLERIVTQVSAPVRWDQCMQTMDGLGASALIELPPAGTLTGLARRASPQLARAALKTPDDLDAARSLLAEHGAPEHHDSGHIPDWRLLVAAHAGTFRADGAAQDTAPGARVRPGTPLGHIQVRSDHKPLTADFAAVVLEWLVEDGDPVAEGQPLVRLQPEPA
ncbi:MAG: acyltransferase domain-containing protein [Actinobacteria bacterium]|nr:acyltransferase domain-containing protein [Actinomycetota bacterium]